MEIYNFRRSISKVRDLDSKHLSFTVTTHLSYSDTRL